MKILLRSVDSKSPIPDRIGLSCTTTAELTECHGHKMAADGAPRAPSVAILEESIPCPLLVLPQCTRAGEAGAGRLQEGVNLVQ